MRRLQVIAGLALLALVVPVPAGAQEAETLPGGCSPDDSSFEVLLLIDQSGSLRRTDPGDQRIAGAKAVVSSYAVLAEQAEVLVQVAGFGTDFRVGDWTKLDQGSLGRILGQVEEVASVSDQGHTDYVYALDGAEQAFASGGGADCRLLFWFTDGEHDLDPDFLGDGLDRFYLDVPVTSENVAEAEALMPGLICGGGGYADRLGEQGVSSQIMLLGDETGMSSDSRRVLRGMGGDPAFDCGPGNGSFRNATDAAGLPYLMACQAQVGLFRLDDLVPAADALTITDETVDAGAVPYPLVTGLRVIARGDGIAPSASSSVAATGQEQIGDDTVMVTVPTDAAPFTLEIEGVEEACAFVAAQAAVPAIQSVAPTMYQGDPASFVVVAEGPHGRLEGDVITRLALESATGAVGTPDGSGWEIAVPALPAQPEFELTVELTSAPGLSKSGQATFPVNEQLNAPTIARQPDPVTGEGVGPFPVELEVDPRDGGSICLLDPNGTVTGAEGETIGVTAAFEGSECVELEAGGPRVVTMTVTFDRSGFAHQVLELRTSAAPAADPSRQEEGVLAVDLDIAPRAQPLLVAAITSGLMVLLLGALWGIAYGVNRLIARIPDPRRHRVRYAEFVAELAPSGYGTLEVTLTEAPREGDLRLPRRTPGQLHAGRLRIGRVVSALPWVAPYAAIGLGTDLVAAHQGPAMPGRRTVAERTYRGRASDALGPLVAIGLSTSQMEGLVEGIAQKAPGVLLFDVREARGTDPGRFGVELATDSLELLGAELSSRVLADTMERTGET
jgi:hypothetical protein